MPTVTLKLADQTVWKTSSEDGVTIAPLDANLSPVSGAPFYLSTFLDYAVNIERVSEDPTLAVINFEHNLSNAYLPANTGFVQSLVAFKDGLEGGTVLALITLLKDHVGRIQLLSQPVGNVLSLTSAIIISK